MLFQRITIIGVGLIGGSIARSLRSAQLAGEIIGCGPDESELQQALSLGVVDRVQARIEAAVSEADLVILACPISATENVFLALADSLPGKAIVTDVGSTKTSVVEAARKALGERISSFVPGHPIAGTEAHGVAASFDGLFRDRVVVLTPHEATDAAATDRVARLWQAMGSRVEILEPGTHDEMLAATSHLPHLLAFALVETLARHRDASSLFRYAAGGFRDFTRIASSGSAMWADICIANRDALLHELSHYQESLQTLHDALGRADRVALEQVFEDARQARDTHLPAIENARGKPAR